MIPQVTILPGNCREVLKTLPSESVHCVVTSPPYWGLRDYGTPPQVWGGRPECAHEWGEAGSVHRGGPTGKTTAMVGRDASGRDATGDFSTGCTCRKCGAWQGHLGLEPTPDLFVEHLVEIFREVRRVLRKDGTAWVNMGDSYNGAGKGGGTRVYKENGQLSYRGAIIGAGRTEAPALKPKDLIGQPWRLAFALQADGWWLRQDIIWAKPNPMPESITDRCTKSHEYIFLLTKAERYFYDAEAIKEPCSESTHARVSQNVMAQEGSHRANGGGKTNGPMRAVVAGSSRKIAEANGSQGKRKEDYEAALSLLVSNRNKRSVWTVPTFSFKGAHFATFPPDLIKPCILAGCPGGGVVLDPFFGSGTTGAVALELGRNAIGIELNPEYIALAKQRTAITPGMALEASA